MMPDHMCTFSLCTVSYKSLLFVRLTDCLTDNFFCFQEPLALHRAAAANKAGAIRRLLHTKQDSQADASDWIDDQDNKVKLHRAQGTLCAGYD